MKFGKFLVGLGIGAVAGLLLAPKKGSELREDIKRESLKAYDNLKNMTKEDLEAMLGQTIETVKKSVDEFDIDTFKATTRDKLNELEAKLEDFAAKVKDSDQYLTIRDGVVDLTQKVNDKIEEVKTPKSNLTSHTARRTFVVTAINEGISESLIAQITSHADVETMRPYITPTLKGKQQVINALDRAALE